MEIVLLLARLVLALIFFVAGTAKAADPAGTRKALIGFGVTEKLAVPMAWCLPFVEILVALALLPTRTAWPGAIAALGLLLVFAAAIAVNLSRGQAPDCNCFGQLHSKPVSWSVFARNIGLAAVAMLIVAQGKNGTSLSGFDWLSGLKAGEIASLAVGISAVGLMGATVVYLRRVISQQSTILARIEAMKKVIDEDYAEPPVEREEAVAPVEGLVIGAPAPGFSLAAVGGEQVTLDDLLAHRKSVLLLFVSPNCSPCKTLMPAIKIWERDYRKQLTIALLSKGDLKENQDRMAGYEASNLLLQGQSQVDVAYAARWTPAAVLISRGGKIASQMSYGDEAIRALVARVVTPSDVKPSGNNGANGNGHVPEITVGTPQSLLNLGEKAPSFSLPNLDGKLVASRDLLGRDTLLLFWDPKCPFCQEMLEDIKRWEENPPKGAPRLVFVSSGDAEDVKAESRRFKSQFLYDSEFDVGLLFGTNLTPSAVLIDREGRIASAAEKGRLNILALAGVRKSPAPAAFRF